MGNGEEEDLTDSWEENIRNRGLSKSENLGLIDFPICPLILMLST